MIYSALLPLMLSALLTSDPSTPTEDTLTLIETVPVETELGSDDIADTAPTWMALIQGATKSLDLAFFYVTDEPNTRLEEVWQAVEATAARGVVVRFLTDERFYKTYPESFERLASMPGIQHRRYDMRADTGGVMHAKYIIVDGQKSYIGSANFDWRSLEHIQELGLVLDSPELSSAYTWTFERDWATAGGETPKEWNAETAPKFPVELTFAGERVRVWPGISPLGKLGDPEWFDLPRMIAWIDTAETRVWMQVMTYRPVGYNRRYWDGLDAALRRAAARGVNVRMQVADWGKRKGTVESLKSLTVMPNLDVNFVTIPQHSSGHIPFARVAHSKFLVIDEQRSWVGSSNWSRGYFFESRNLGAFMEGRRMNARLSRYHQQLWNTDMSVPIDPSVEYEAPRVGD